MNAAGKMVWRYVVQNRTVSIVVAAGLTGFCVAMIVALQFSGRSSGEVATATATIIGLAAPTILALVNVVKTSDVQSVVTDVQSKVNGHLDRLASAAGIPAAPKSTEVTSNGTDNAGS